MLEHLRDGVLFLSEDLVCFKMALILLFGSFLMLFQHHDLLLQAVDFLGGGVVQGLHRLLMHFQHLLPLLLKNFVLAIQLLNVLGLLDNILGLGNGFCKSEKLKYTVSTRRIWAQNQVGMRKRKQTLALGDLFLQEGSFTLFSFQVYAHLLVLVIGHAPPSTLVLWKNVKVKTLFGLLGASSRKFST